MVYESAVGAVRRDNYGTQVQGEERNPGEHLSLYAERDGGWVLDVDGAADKSKPEKFAQRTCR
jgi:hypothetical protein